MANKSHEATKAGTDPCLIEYFHLNRQKRKQKKIGAKTKKDDDKKKKDGKFCSLRYCNLCLP